MQPVIANLTFDDHFQNCFIEPCAPKDLPKKLFRGLRPTLHLLRRDLELLYGKEAVQYQKDGLKPPFLVLTGIMTGIDLMSNLYCGEDEVSEHVIRGNQLLREAGNPKRLSEFGAKFKKFLREVGGMADNDIRLLWNLRGSVVHSYGLVFRDKGFEDLELSVEESEQLIKFEKCRYTVNLWQLKTKFLDMIRIFRKKLENPDPALRLVFEREMVARGYIYIDQSNKGPRPSL